MSTYTKSEAVAKALELVSQSIASQQLKLIGSHVAADSAKKNATSDAAYLSTLANELASAIEKMG